MDSKKIRTRQEIKSMANPKGKNFIIGLDLGYSATKVFYENGYFCFPSYAKKLSNGMLDIPSDKDILYKDADSKDTYIVGYSAQNMIDESDTNDSMGELFSRKRYSDKRFKIICNTALAIATRNKNDNKEIYIQTGLPSSYVDGDKAALKKVLSKESSFYLKIGKEEWKEYKISVKEENIDVIPQPAGSLYSILIKNDGNYVDNAKEILCDNILVMDIGFGTFDWYGLKNRTVSCKESTDEYGMLQVLSSVSKQILDDTNEDIRVSSIQKNLETGKFTYINEDEMQAEEKSIAPYIDTANKEIFKNAMDKAKSVTNAFRGYRYLVVTGGTGEAWFEDIKKWLEGMKTLKIIGGNINDHLPFIYSNSRGYYMYRYSRNKR